MADLAAWRDALAPAVAAATRFSELIVVENVDSTQDEARRRAAAPGTVLVTLRQAAGHGRLGSAWADTGADGLALSAVVPPVGSTPAWSPERLAIASAVAAAEAVEGALGRAVGIKWPNDLVAGPRKLAGILIEGDPQRAVIGVGINVHQTAWPAELAPRAVSLAQLGAATTRRGLAAGLITALDAALGLEDAELTAAFAGRDVLVGRVATFRTNGPAGPETVTGRVERLDPLTGLGVRTELDPEVRWLPAASTRVVDA